MEKILDKIITNYNYRPLKVKQAYEILQVSIQKSLLELESLMGTQEIKEKYLPQIQELEEKRARLKEILKENEETISYLESLLEKRDEEKI